MKSSKAHAVQNEAETSGNKLIRSSSTMSRHTRARKTSVSKSQQQQRFYPATDPNDFHGLYDAHHCGSDDDHSSGWDTSHDDDDDAFFRGGQQQRTAICTSSYSIMNSSSSCTAAISSDMNNNISSNDSSLMYSEDEEDETTASMIDRKNHGEGSTSSLDLSSVASFGSNSSSSSIHAYQTTSLHSGFLEALEDARSRSRSGTSSSLESSSDDGSFCTAPSSCFESATTTTKNEVVDVLHNPANSSSSSHSHSSSSSTVDEEESNLHNCRSFDDNYIFSDDDDGSSTDSLLLLEQKQQHSTPQKQQQQQQQQPQLSNKKNEVLSNSKTIDRANNPFTFYHDHPLEDDNYKMFVASIQASHHHQNKPSIRRADNNTCTAESQSTNVSPEKEPPSRRLLGRRQPEQGSRIIARQPEGSPHTAGTASLSEDDDLSSTSSSKARTSSLFQRVRRRFTRSPSPLDHVVEIVQDDNNNDSTAAGSGGGVDTTTTNNNNNPHRVSDLAVAALAEQGCAKRNLLVDFGAWEEAAQARLSSTCSVIAEEEESDSSCGDNGDDDEKSVLFIKAVSLMAQDFVVDASLLPAQRINVRDGLDEPRTASEDVALALDVEEEGRELLTHIRGRSGIIENPDDDENENGEFLSNNNNDLPWIHLQDNVWMPHYEEYVVRSVHFFQRRLQQSMSKEQHAEL